MPRDLQVLLLDDESVICDIIKREFRKHPNLKIDFIEVPSGTGHEAIALLNKKERAPDISFIDLRLNNGLSGFDVIDYLVGRFGREGIYCVILTGCWEGSVDWDKGTRFVQEGKVKRLIGKWGIGIVIEELRSILSEFDKGTP